MIDPLFKSPHPEYIEKQTLKARAYCARLDKLSDLKDFLQQACQEYLRSTESEPEKLRTLFTSGLSGSPPKHLSHDHYLLLEALASSTETPDEESDFREASQVILSEVLGYTLANETPSHEVVNRALILLDLYGCQYWGTFKTSLVEELENNESKRHQWIEKLSEMPSSVADCIELDRNRRVENALKENDKEQRENSDPFEVWRETNLHFYLNREVISRLYLLFELAPKEAINAVEKLPTADLSSMALEHLNFSSDPELMLDTIQESPDSYVNDVYTGQPILLQTMSSAISYAINLRNIADQAKKIATDSSSKEEAEKLETEVTNRISSWFEKFFETLIKRDNAKEISIEFAAFLAKEQQRLSDRQISKSVVIVALNSLLSRFDSIALSSIEERAKKIPCRSQYPFLVIAGSLVFMSSRRESTQAIWNWYKEFLLTSGEDWSEHVNPYMIDQETFCCLGNALALDINVIKEWKGAWQSLYQQRFQARFHPDKKLVASSEHLLLTGIGIINGLLLIPRELDGEATEVKSNGREKRQTMWKEVFESFRFLIFGQSSWLSSSILLNMAHMFAYLPPIFTDKSEEVLKKVVPVLASDSELSIRSAYWLSQNGMDIQQVRTIFELGGISLKKNALPYLDGSKTCAPYEAADTLKIMANHVSVSNDQNS